MAMLTQECKKQVFVKINYLDAPVPTYVVFLQTCISVMFKHKIFGIYSMSAKIFHFVEVSTSMPRETTAGVYIYIISTVDSTFT